VRSRPDPSSFRRVNRPLSPGNAGASPRKPTPARPCTLARLVTNRTKRSDQAIALRRRPARMRRIDGLRSVTEMVQNPLDDGGLLNAGDHPQCPAALSAGLNIDGEHPLEPLRPAHRPLPIDGRWLIGLHSLAGRRTRFRHDPRPVAARRCEQAMLPGEVRGHERQRTGRGIEALKIGPFVACEGARPCRSGADSTVASFCMTVSDRARTSKDWPWRFSGMGCASSPRLPISKKIGSLLASNRS